jgi:hypothetical protein
LTTFLHEWISSWSDDPFFDVCRGMLLKRLFLVLEDQKKKKNKKKRRKKKEGKGATVEERKIEIERPSLLKLKRWLRTAGRASRHLVVAKEKFVFLFFVIISIV